MAESCTTQNCCSADPWGNPIEPDEDTFIVDVTIDPEDSGTVTGDGAHDKLSTVTLEATPESGFEFVAWQDANGFALSELNPWNFTVTQNMSVVAKFAVV